MRAKLVAIRNSRGVRIPATYIREAGLSNDVEIRIEGRSVIVEGAPRIAREGWAEAIDAALPDEITSNDQDWHDLPNRFDEEE